MSFWAYMLHCRGGLFYVGHTDDLERRIAAHQSGLIPGFTRERQPVELVWSGEFPTRDEAKAAERKLKGWSHAKKLALIRGDWAQISASAKKKDSASTSSAQADEGETEPPNPAHPELVEGPSFALHPHPGTPARSVNAVQVEVARNEHNQLVAIFTASSSARSILVPPPVPDTPRADGLWETTCFEVFIKRTDEAGYYEFNFAPSTGWAAYAFESYRQGMSNLALDPPVFDVAVEDTQLRVTIAADVSRIAGLAADAPWQIALSAVIEETDGTKSYWALAHPPGKADFHSPACFAASLAPRNQP